MRKHWGKALVGAGVSLLLLWWALRGADFAEVWTRIEDANFWLLGAAVFVATSSFFIRAVRWKVELAPVKADTSLRARWSAACIGGMSNNVLPARLGEFARAYAFSRMETVSASAAFGSLVVERTLDSAVLLVFLILPLLGPGFPVAGVLSRGEGEFALRFAIGLVTVLVVGLVLMAVWPRGFVRVTSRVAGTVLPRSISRPLIDALEAFLDSMKLLRSPGKLALAFLWSVVLWAYNAFSFWLGMKAFGIHATVISACFTQAVVGFAVALPSGPGFVGTFQAASIFALSKGFGVPHSRSLAFAFGYYVASWIPIVVIGLWYAWKLGLSFGEMGRAEERVEGEIEEEHADARGIREHVT